MDTKIVDMKRDKSVKDIQTYTLPNEYKHKGVRIREVYIDDDFVDRVDYRFIRDPRTISFTRKMPDGIEVTAMIDIF